MLLVNSWYALYVRSNWEQVIAASLVEKGYESFVPTYQVNHKSGERAWIQRLPLFANYVFCKITRATTAPVVTTPGVVRIVGTGKHPVPVDDDEILALQRIAESGVPSIPWPFPKVGESVEIECGPLSGLKGVVCRTGNANHFVVSVAILNRSVAVHIGCESLRLIRAGDIRCQAA